MESFSKFLLRFLLLMTASYELAVGNDSAKESDGLKALKQSWGHIQVREGAHMFFWTFFAENYTNKPLVLWLQGGPGVAASGLGNFFELGPYNLNNEDNPHAWTRDVSVLLVDSPVGTGYSYVNATILLAQGDERVSCDLLEFLVHYYESVSDFQSVPLYIFGEGYGGKIAAELSLKIVKAIESNKLNITFSGVAMGDSWISPIHAAESYANYLYANSFIDASSFEPISSHASKILINLKKGKFYKATELFEDMISMMAKKTDGINLFNINSNIRSKFGEKNQKGMLYLYHNYINDTVWKSLYKEMNSNVQKKLMFKEKIVWGKHDFLVYQSMRHDLMKSSVETVETLLNTTKLEIMIYTSQFDAISPAISNENWVSSLRWPGIKKWDSEIRRPYATNSKSNEFTKGFFKKYKNFQFHWILRAGHLPIMDAGATMRNVMCHFVKKCHTSDDL